MLLDFTGGSFSILQMVLISYNYGKCTIYMCMSTVHILTKKSYIEWSDFFVIIH